MLPDASEHLLNDPDAAPLVRPRRVQEDVEMDITPMIDMTFLLLIFFLVSSTMNASAQVQLPEARYGELVSGKNALVITLAETGGPRAAVYTADGKVPDRLVDGANLKDQEEQVEAYVRDAVTANPQIKNVLIKSDRSVKARETARITLAAGRAGSVQVYYAVLEVD